MRFLAFGLLAMVTLAISSNAGTEVPGPQRVEVMVESGPPVVEQTAQPGITCQGQRWEAYEVEEPVTLMRRVKKWRLVSYPIAVPDPGPMPQEQIISEPVITTIQQRSVIDCPPCEVLQYQPQVQYQTQYQPQPMVNVQTQTNCPDGNCVQGAGTRQRRGLFGGFFRR